MLDRRQEILDCIYNKYIISMYGDDGSKCKFSTHEPWNKLAIEAMDEYMKECVLLAFEFMAHETKGHSFNETKGELEFKYKGEWISKEKLFENFL